MVCVPHLIVGLIMSDVFVANLSTPLVDNNRLECTGLCHLNMTCSSFFFNQDSNSCYIQSGWINNVEKSGTPTGIHYFQVYTDICQRIGYQYIRSTDMCLKVSNNTKTWTNARAECESDGGHLVKIDTEEKNNVIMDMLKDSKIDRPYFGATDRTTEGDWRWDGTNSRIDFENWKPGEPNGNEEENCGVLRANSDGKWIDVRCYTALHFICEIS